MTDADTYYGTYSYEHRASVDPDLYYTIPLSGESSDPKVTSGASNDLEIQTPPRATPNVYAAIDKSGSANADSKYQFCFMFDDFMIYLLQQVANIACKN